MKRFIILFLACILCMSNMALTADAAKGVNIAPYATITTNGDHESGWYPTSRLTDGVWHDGVDAKQWKSAYAGAIGKSSITFDLGAVYGINTIVFQEGGTQVKGYVVEIAKSADFSDVEVIFTQNGDFLKMNTVSFVEDKFCRYVRVRTPSDWFNGTNNMDVFTIGEVEIYCENYLPPIRSVSISGLDNGIRVGESKQISLLNESGNLIQKSSVENITYKSSDEKIVTVNENGVVTAHAGGIAKITASVQQFAASTDTVNGTQTVYVYDNGICIYNAQMTSESTKAVVLTDEAKENVSILAAQYQDEKLLDVQLAYSGSLQAGQTLKLDVPHGDASSGKLFVWSNTMTPICRPVIPTKIAAEELVDFTVTVEEGREPVILQLTDTQIIDGGQERYENRLTGSLDEYWATDKVEDRCYGYIRDTIAATQPDLILLTGDLVYGEFDDAGTAFTSFVDFMDSFGIPWAPVFGNHDNESAKGADWQCAQFENARHCLFKQRTLTGNGNYTVAIQQGDKLKRVFFMLDSNGCGGMSSATSANGHSRSSVGFGEDQITWYTQTATNIKNAFPTTKFTFAFHIQPAIFKTAYEKYGFTNSGTINSPINIDKLANKADGDFGYIGRDLKSAWDSDFSIYNGMKNLGTDSILVGHEHCNSASVLYDGVRFQYGQKSSTYDRANYISDSGAITGAYYSTDTPMIGGTVMKLSETDGAICDAYIYYCSGDPAEGDSDSSEGETDSPVNGLSFRTGDLYTTSNISVGTEKFGEEFAHKCTANVQDKIYINTNLLKNKSTFTFSVYLPETSTTKLSGYGEFAIRVKPNSAEPVIDGKAGNGYIEYNSSATNDALKLVHGEWKTYTIDISELKEACTEFAFVLAKGNTIYLKDLVIE